MSLEPDDATFVELWVVYKNPSDYPGKFVVRRQWASRAGEHKCVYPECVTDSLDKARSVIPGGLYRLDRMPGDDPVILEVWL